MEWLDNTLLKEEEETRQRFIMGFKGLSIYNFCKRFLITMESEQHVCDIL